MLKKRRTFILVTLGALLIFVAWGYERWFFARPIGEGPAGPPVDAAAFKTSWTDRRVKLLGIGDSVTAGLGAKTASHSYFNRLIRNPPDEFESLEGICLSAVLPNLEYENIAVSGSNSLHHLDAVQKRLQPHPDEVFGLVVITTGGNDLIHSYGRAPPKEGAMYGATLAQAKPWIDNFARRLDEILARIEAVFPGGCEIYLGDIYDPTDGVGDAPSVYLPRWPDGLAIHAEYNRVLHAAAENRPNVHLVPLHATFLGHGSHCRQFWRSTYRADDPHFWYYDNIEDPNDRGYDALRRIFLREIAAHSSLRNSPGEPREP